MICRSLSRRLTVMTLAKAGSSAPLRKWSCQRMEWCNEVRVAERAVGHGIEVTPDCTL